MTIWHLTFDDLEGIESNVRLRDFERLFEDVAVFVLNHQQLAMRLLFHNLLKNTQMINGTEESSPRELGDRSCVMLRS